MTAPLNGLPAGHGSKCEQALTLEFLAFAGLQMPIYLLGRRKARGVLTPEHATQLESYLNLAQTLHLAATRPDDEAVRRACSFAMDLAAQATEAGIGLRALAASAAENCEPA